MKSQDYLELVSMIIEGQLTLEGFIELRGVDQAAAEKELEKLSPVAFTYNTTEPKPIYLFRASDYPNLGQLFHCSKLFSFAKGGSPYKEDEISEYDTRKDHPYIQGGVYDPNRKVFAAGLRFLSLRNSMPFHMSTMYSLFFPTEEFIKDFLPHSLEIGQTFTLPDGGALGGNYLFSTMAAVIVLNPNARFFCGKPTIEGRIPDVSKEIISAFAYDAFNPERNNELNPYRKDLFLVADGIVAPTLRSFEEIISQYNLDVQGKHPVLQYDQTLSVSEKRMITTKLLLYYGGSLPPMFKFYSFLIKEDGMICLGPVVKNPVYTTEAWEFPVLMDRTKIASIHKAFLDYYIGILKDVGDQY